MKKPWQEEKGEEEDKDNIIDDDVNDDDDQATASETLLSKPSRRETTTTNNTNIPFPHHPPHSSKRQQRHHHHHQTRLILLLTSILILCPCIFLLGFTLGSSRQTTTRTTPPQSITNDDINDNNITNQPCFSHPSNPFPLLPLPPLPPPHLEASEKETPPLPPNPSLQTKIFNGSFFHETKFRAKASPEVDRVWDSLGINCSSISSLSSAKKVYQLMAFFLDRSILIPPHLAPNLGLKPNQHVHAKRKFGGGYVANLEGLHHLHCLVCLMHYAAADFFLVWFMLVLTYSIFGGDIFLRIYCVKLSIGISRIIIVVVKERFEMMRGLWRSMLVS